MDSVLRRQELREEIRRILLAAHFDKLDGPVAHALLDPETLYINVSELAEALSGTYPERR
jgi:hypothetical protein